MLKFYVMANDRYDARPRPGRVVVATFEAGGQWIRFVPRGRRRSDARGAWRQSWSVLRSLINDGETGVKIVCLDGDRILGKADAAGVIEHWVCEP